MRRLEARAAEAIELYHRASVTLNASRRAEAEPVLVRHGQDEGIALRAGHPGGAVGFAAADGLSEEGALWCLERCREDAARSVGRPETPAWSWSEGAEPLIDHERGPGLPSSGQLTDWLGLAWEGLRAQSGTRGLRVLEAWIEVGATIETWASGGRHRASRVRVRGWAMARLQGAEVLRGAGRPLAVARRRWSELDPGAWVEIQRDRWWTPVDPVAAPGGRVPVLFDPLSASILVSALAREVHRQPAHDGVPVGPAWRVADDPLDPQALTGGPFDDAGFATRRVALADGRTVCAHVDGPGTWRRPSFRDRPVRMASHLVVDRSPGEAPPPRGVLVSGLVIHALTPEAWLLEVDGHLLEQGLPGPPMVTALIRVSPREMVRRCVAAVGPARLGTLGVCTPALVFEDLDVLAAL